MCNCVHNYCVWRYLQSSYSTMFSCLQMHPHEAIAETAVVHPQGNDDFITASSNGQIEENLYEGENEGQELEGAESDTNGNLDDTIDEPIEPGISGFVVVVVVCCCLVLDFANLPSSFRRG